MPTLRSKWLLAILCLALCLRLALFAVLFERHDPHDFILPDTVGYMRYVDNILAGHGFSESTSSPYIASGMRTPTLPYALAATKAIFGDTTPYVLVQILLALFIVYLSYAICLTVSGSHRLALAAALLAAIEPYSVFINMSMLTETIFSALILAGIYAGCLYLRDGSWKALAVCSALFGICTLTRPIMEFSPVLLLCMIALREAPRAYARYALAAIVPFVLVLSPWVIRNYELFGSFSISSGGFQNVYSDLGASIISYRDGTPSYIAKKNLNEQYAQEHGIPEGALQQDLAQSQGIFREGLRMMIANPKETALTFVTVCIAFFTNDAWTYYLQWWGWFPHYEFGFSPTYSLLTAGPIATAERVIDVTGPTLVVPLLGRIFWVATSALFFAGLWILWRRRGAPRLYAVFFALLVAYTVALCFSNGSGINGRYRYPINPLFFTCACIAVSFLIDRLRTWRRNRA